MRKSPGGDASSIITAGYRQEKYIEGAALAALVVAPQLVLPILLSNAYITVAMGLNEPEQVKRVIDAWDRLNEKELIHLERTASSLVQSVRDLREARQQLRENEALAQAAHQEVDKCNATAGSRMGQRIGPQPSQNRPEASTSDTPHINDGVWRGGDVLFTAKPYTVPDTSDKKPRIVK